MARTWLGGRGARRRSGAAFATAQLDGAAAFARDVRLRPHYAARRWRRDNMRVLT